MEKIKVLYATNFHEIKLGGQKSMVSLLENINQDEYELHVICPKDGELANRCREIGCKVHYHRVWSRKLSNIGKRIKSFLEFRRILSENKIQILHSDNELDSFIYSRRLRHFKTEHLWHLRLAVKHKHDHEIQQYAGAIIGISEAMRARLSEPNEPKYRTIYNGVDTQKFKPVSLEEKTALRDELNMDDAFSILFVGQLIKEKGLYELINAFVNLVKSKKDRAAKLYIVGMEVEEGLQAKLEAVINQEIPEWRNSVVFKAHTDEVQKWMQAADILVLPSHVEGMGRVLIESMACGTPVIGSNIPGIKEVISDDTGLLVPEKNPLELAVAIEKMMTDNKLYEEFKVRGRKRAIEHFDIRVHAEKISDVYRKLVTGEQ